mgnify:FL=1
MSPQLRNFMLDQKIDIELLKTKLMKVVTITSAVDMSPANFFGTLEEMLKKL